MKQDIISLRNYEKGFEHWKRTELQNSLFDYHSAAKENLGENSEPLESMCKILGNRGLSYEKRTERFGNWLNNIGSGLNYFEKSDAHGMLDKAEIYVSQNEKRIKN